MSPFRRIIMLAAAAALLGSAEALQPQGQQQEATLLAEVQELKRKLSSLQFMAAFSSEKKLKTMQEEAKASKHPTKPLHASSSSSWSTQLEAKENVGYTTGSSAK